MKARKRFKLVVLSTGLVFLLGSIASAAQMKTYSITVDDGGSNFMAGAAGTFSLPKFDDKGGTRVLQQVTLQITTYFFGGRNALDSESQFAGLATVMIGSNLMVNAPLSLSVITTQPTQIAGNLPITADDETGEPDFLDNGPDDDCVSIAGQDFIDTRSSLLSDPPDDLSDYVGDGKVWIGFYSAVNSIASATVAPSWARVEAPEFYFDAEITYAYIPEPATLGLLGMGGLVLLLRRRRKQTLLP